MNKMEHQPINAIDTTCFTYRHWLRLVFTIFSLYLMGDAFYRWDAFRFHSTFAEYLPNVALAFILWSILGFIDFHSHMVTHESI